MSDEYAIMKRAATRLAGGDDAFEARRREYMWVAGQFAVGDPGAPSTKKWATKLTNLARANRTYAQFEAACLRRGFNLTPPIHTPQAVERVLKHIEAALERAEEK